MARQLESGFEHIRVQKVGGHIGATVEGVRVGDALPRELVSEIRRALLAHRVLFLRGQDHVGDDLQRTFAELFGTLTKPHPTVTGEGRAILPVDSAEGKANSWHTDVTFVDRIPAISILRAITLPPYGGSTAWANTVRAYATLSPSLRALADGLWAVHSNLYDYAGVKDEQRIGGVDVKEQRYREEFARSEFVTEHPVVRIHPETGERSLVLGHFVRGFVGLGVNDSHDVLQLLQRHIIRLENTVRWNWREGDIAIWDNRATQHYAVADYDDHPRLMHRVTLAGEVPVSIDGERSVVRTGDASAYSPVAGTALR